MIMYEEAAQLARGDVITSTRHFHRFPHQKEPLTAHVHGVRLWAKKKLFRLDVGFHPKKVQFYVANFEGIAVITPAAWSAQKSRTVK